MDKKTVVRKADLVAALVQKTGISQRKAREAVEAVFAGIIQGVKRGPVTVPEFGAFRKQCRCARKGHNPRTGECIDIPCSVFPIFAPGKNLKERLNDKKRKS